MWATVFAGKPKELRPKAEDTLLGFAYVPLSGALSDENEVCIRYVKSQVWQILRQFKCPFLMATISLQDKVQDLRIAYLTFTSHSGCYPLFKAGVDSLGGQMLRVKLKRTLAKGLREGKYIRESTHQELAH